MSRQNNPRLTRGLSALIVLVSALWGMVPAAPGASRVAAPLLSQKTARATGEDTALAVTTGGGQTCSIWNNALYCWGFNTYGQIGDGTTNVRYTPTLVQGMDSGVTDVSAGSRHTCAIKNGALYCWGSNYYGQLGDGTTTNRLTPVAVQGMSSGVTDVAAGDNHTCAIKRGALFCWGYNAAGQLGDGTTIDRNIPVAVQYMSSGVTAITLSNHNTFNHRTCAIKNSALYCWGDNYTRALGYTTSQTCSRYYNHPCSLLPGLVTNMSSNVTAVDAGADHTCAVRNGALYCWGSNLDGQIGDGTHNNIQSTPTAVLNMSNNVTSVSAGSSHTCAIRSSALYCWGSNWAGQIGDGTTTRRTVPAAVQNMGNNVTATSAGGAYTCAIKSAEEVYCWGDNFHGQLGDGTQTSRSAPVRVIGLSPFRKASPANEAIGLPTNPVLRWGSRSGANHYRYCVSSTPGCIPDVSAGSGLSVTLNLSPGNYYWQVRACLTSDCSSFVDANNGTHWSFSVSPYRAEIARSHNEIPASNITAYGKLTVTLRTWDNRPVYAAPIQLETSRADVDAIAPLGGTTNRNGQLFMTIASLEPGTSVISLTSRLYPGVVLTRTTVRFTQYISSTLSASPPYLRVGNNTSRLRLSLVGSDGFPASNKTVAFFSSRPEDQIIPPTIQTDSNGRAEVQIRSTLSGTAVITVHNLTDNFAVPLSTTVRFIPTETRTVVAEIFASPDVITVGMTTTLVVAVRDAQTGSLLPFYPVRFVAERATDNLEVDSNRPAIAQLRPTVYGTAVVTAVDALNDLPLARAEVKVTRICPQAPTIEKFVPSYEIGYDTSYPQLYGIPVLDIPLDADITVDWKGCVPNYIEFALSNGKLISVSVAQSQSANIEDYYGLRSFYLNKDLPIGLGILKVTAVTTDGVTSPTYLFPTQASEMPWLVIQAIGALGELMESPRLQNKSLWGGLIKFQGKKYEIALNFPPKAKEWKISPGEVSRKIPNTRFTDANGNPRTDKEGKQLIENQTTSIKLGSSFKLSLLCTKPPEANVDLSASKKELSLGNNAWLSGISGSFNADLNVKLGRNPICLLFATPNEDFYVPDATGKLNLDVDVSKKFEKSLIGVLLTFIPPAKGPYLAICESGVLSALASLTGQSFDCDKFSATLFGSVSLVPKINLGLNTGLELYQQQLHLRELTGEFNPSVKVAHNLSWFDNKVKSEATAGVYLASTFGISRPSSMEEFTPIARLVINADAKFSVVVFDIKWLKYENKWQSDKFIIDFTQPSSPTIMALQAAIADPAEVSVTHSLIPPAPTTPDYSGFRTATSSQGFSQPQLLTAQSTATASSIITTILASGQLTYSTVSLAYHPDTQRALLVWTQDDPTKPIGGSREIFYSLWDGTSWSSPSAVTSNDLHDLAPKVSWLDQNRAIVMWEQFKSTLDPQDTSAAEFNHLEIAYAIYDAATDQWSAPVRLTDDDNLDHSIALARDNTGQVLAAWTSLADENVAIQTALFGPDGQLIRRNVAVQGPVSMFDLSVAISGDNAAIAFTRLVSPTTIVTPTFEVLTTQWDANTNTWTEPVAQPAQIDQQSDDQPALAYDNNGELWLMFQRSGYVPRADGDGYDQVNYLMMDAFSDSDPALQLPMDLRKVSDLRLLNTARGLLALMRVQELGQTDLYAAITDLGAFDWNPPVRLTNDPSFETSVDAQANGNGDLLAAYIRTNYEIVTTTETIAGIVLTSTKRQATNSELVFLSRIFGTLSDVTIPPDGITVTIPNGRPLPGTPVTVSVTVANQEEMWAAPFLVRIYNGNPATNGSLLLEEELTLEPGFTHTVSFGWTLSQTDAIDIYATVDEPDHLLEANEDNNVAFIRLFGPDVEMKEMLALPVDNSAQVETLIHSVGSTATLPGLLTVTLSLSNSVLLTETAAIPSIAPGDLYTALTSLDLSTLPSGTYTVTVTVGAAGKEIVAYDVIDFLPNLAFESESLDATDLTVPLIRVEGVVRNTSPFTVEDVLVAVFDPARTVQTGLVATTTIPLIRPGESVPVGLLVEEAMLCGLSLWVNPYGLPGTFLEQRFGDNALHKSGNEEMCTRAGYELSTRDGVAPLTVVFTNTSTLNTISWEWDFGDGTTSTERDPGAHTYTEPGVYTVTLRATSPYTTNFWQEPRTIRVYAPAVADFESSTRSVLVGEVVSFTNRSTGDISAYRWDFGDGSTSSSYEPLHVYDRPGRYTVALAVGGAGGSDTITKSDYITVYGIPTSLTLTAAPATLPAGNLSTLTATVTDQDGNPVADGTVVSFTTSLGSVSPISATTVNGVATATLSAVVLGTATVTATVGSLNGTARVTFIAGPPAQLSLTATPAVIAANGISQSVVMATVRDAFGNPVPDAQVNFLAGIGRFSPASGTTDANGQATARLTSLVPGTENVFATVETLVAQTPVTYQLPPASQSGLNGSSIVTSRASGVVRKNDLITYTLTITNNGNGTVTDILLVAPIPNGTTYVAGSASGGNYASAQSNNTFGPLAVQNVVAWSGSLAPGAAHTLSYVVQVAILEGQIINQPRVYVNNEDTGIDLGSVVQVEAHKAHIPIVRRR